MNRTHAQAGCLLAFFSLAIGASLSAQVAPAAPAGSNSDADEPVVLSPFVVSAEEDQGYAAKSTLAGTRIRTELKDVGSSISVITQKFLEDTHSTKADDLLVYTPNTEVSGQGGNFLGRGDGTFLTGVSTNLKPTTRVRGLTDADTTRDFFLTDIPWDSYNTGRVDLQRGPNSILFGIGSPAGIINASVNGAAFKDHNRVSASFGSFGSTRYTADFNKVLIPRELAVRLSLLRDNTKYRQDPAFRDDRRISAAAKWDPGFFNKGSAHTSFRANFEKGKINANMPRNTPPLDALSPWFTDIDPSSTKNAKATYKPSEVDLTLRNYPGYSSPGNNNATALIVQMAPTGSQGASLLAPADQDAGIRGVYEYFEVGPATFDKIAIDNHFPGADINAWKARSLTDRSVFDYYNNMLEGPNNFQYSDFNVINVAASQSFLNDKLGVELVYDRQKTKLGGFSYLDPGSVSVTVDMMQQLTFNQPNPEVTKPMFLSGGGNGDWTDRTREVWRATAFGDLDFAKIVGKDTFVSRIFGRNVFTALWSSQKNNTRTGFYRGYLANQFISTDATAKPFHTLSFYNGDVFLKNYLGAPITGSSAAGLNLQGIKTRMKPQSSSVLAYNYTTGLPETIAYPLINNVDAPDRDKIYSGGTKDINKVDSTAFVWQGYWLDGSLVPMFGYRTDKQNSRAVGNAPTYRIGPRTVADIYSPSWNLPLEGSVAKVRSKTYSLVTHLPESWRAKLPGRLDVSLIYNQSENIQPGANRKDLLGESIADPTGKTKEYGVAITALDDRLSLRVTKYKTSVTNATLGGINTSEIVLSEIWGQWAAFNTRDLTKAGDPNRYHGSYIYGYANGDTTKPVTWQPDGGPHYKADGKTVGDYPNDLLVKAFNEQRAAVTDWFANQITDPRFIKLWLDVPDATAVDYLNLQNPSFDYKGQFPAQLSGPAGMVVTGDTVSAGYELELVAAPIKGLQVAFNASKTSAQRSGLAKSYTDWLEARWAVFQGPAGDIRMWGNAVGPSNDDRADPVNGNAAAHGTDGETVRGRYGRLLMAPYNLYRALEGSDVPELKPWAFNAIANYTFQEGALRGFGVGGGYRWQDRNVVGFPTKVVNGVTQYDVANPYKGSTEGAFDGWLSYGRSVSRRIKWSAQLNIRNILANGHLSRVTVQPDGSPAAYRIPEPRTITLTNTFEF